MRVPTPVCLPLFLPINNSRQDDLVSAAWYVLRSKPHSEHALYRQVSLGKHEIYYPSLRVKPVNPRSRRIVPYFPGYMFVHVNLDRIGRSAFRWMPFSMGLISFGNEPAQVPEAFIHALQLRLEEIRQGGPVVIQSFKKGEQVVIRHGPFEGYSALFDVHVPGGQRAKVLIEFLSGQYMRLNVQTENIEARAH